MKKTALLILFTLVFTLASFAEQKSTTLKDTTTVRLSKIITNKLLPSKKEEQSIYTFSYNKNNFIENVVIDKINTYSSETGLIKQFNKEEIDYIYNSKNQIEEERFFNYYGSERREKKTICYYYDDEGYISSNTVIVEMPIDYVYEYNEACVLSEKKRMITETKSDLIWHYIYDNNQLVDISLDLQSDHRFSDCTAYLFDKKNNPKILGFPEQYCLAFPYKYNKNNPVEVEEIVSNLSVTNFYEYTYNSENYPTKCTNKHYKNGILQYTKTIEYFY